MENKIKEQFFGALKKVIIEKPGLRFNEWAPGRIIEQFEQVIRTEILGEMQTEDGKGKIIKYLAKNLKTSQDASDYWQAKHKETSAALEDAIAQDEFGHQAKIRRQDRRIVQQRNALRNLEEANAKLRGKLYIIENSALQARLRKAEKDLGELQIEKVRLSQALERTEKDRSPVTPVFLGYTIN